ncbi:hypothetical protein IAR55_000114 [Kwoniella newhampshirensis]|uniref:RRM domain-containing protein n=1 Tax=Kwoniella newhampshirensis TaxID=1651941 RepID=A0AAW0Z5R1_9TREE
MSAENVSDIPKADEGHRVYVGNLSFTATEQQVREFVAPAGGEILSVNLPLRFGRRPAGYAFVSYKDEADAKKVVEQFNDKELGDRKLRLEIAKPAEEVAELRKAKDEKRKVARDAAKAAKAEAAATAKESAPADAEVTEGENKTKKKSKKSSKKPRRRLPGEGEEGEAAGETSESASKARIDVNGADGEAKTEEKKARAPRPKKERQPRLALTGEESKNTIFVANLPFNVDDEGLAAIFTNLSINVKSAKVVKGIRRARPGSRPFRASKGFGFVELENESQQTEAVEKVEGTLVGDRNITAKIAKEMKPIEVEQAVEAETA